MDLFWFFFVIFFFSSRRRHTRYWRDWSSDVCSSDLGKRQRRAGGGVLLDDRGGRLLRHFATDELRHRFPLNFFLGFRREGGRSPVRATSRSPQDRPL